MSPINQADSNCGQSCSDSCSESCTESCSSEACSENCSQSCTENCQNTCQQEECQLACCQLACCSLCAGSGGTEQCGASTCSIMSPGIILPLLGSIFLTLIGTIILGFIQAFDSKGPLYITLIGSGFLAVGLSGIRLSNKQHHTCKGANKEIKSVVSTKLGLFKINHSHHAKHLRENGHEFKIGNDKYFCTGCYGLLIGTIISIIITLLYIGYGINELMLSILVIMTPIAFVPIIVRYFIIKNVKTPIKFLSNSLLPVGCCFLFLILENQFQNWTINVGLVLLTITAAYLRGLMPKLDK